MKIPTRKCLSVAIALSLLTLFAGSLSANVVLWDADDGDWNVAENWEFDAVPGEGDDVRFESIPEQSDTITVDFSGSHNIERMRYSTGKHVTMNMADGSSLDINSRIDASNYSGSVIGPAGLTIIGPETGSATFVSRSFSSGRNESDVSTETVFSGPNLSVKFETSFSTVGRAGDNNSLIVENGAVLQSTESIWLSDARHATYGQNNAMIVRGAGSALEQTGSSATFFIIASRPAEAHLSGNHLLVEDGGRATITGDDPETEARIGIGLGGSGEWRTDNFIRVTGGESSLELLGNTHLQIGRGQSTQRDNYVMVDNGGTITSEGLISVRRGNNLIIGEDGTLHSTDEINVERASTFSLNETGQLTGSVVVNLESNTAEEPARFEAAGGGIASGVEVNLDPNSVLAVGASDATEASVLTLDSTVNMAGDSLGEDTSQLELTLFGDNAMDSIEFDGGILNLASPPLPGLDAVELVVLLGEGYQPATGDTFQAFTGNVNITNEFTAILLPELEDDLEWDLSAFNSAGDWTLSVVGEGGFDDWLAGHFTEDERADEEVGGPLGDPVGDGLRNLMAYALGLDPWAINTANLPATEMRALEVDDEVNDYLTFSFDRPAGLGDVTYQVTGADDLESWGDEPVRHSVADNGDGTVTELWRDSVTIDEADGRFLRLEVSHP